MTMLMMMSSSKPMYWVTFLVTHGRRTSMCTCSRPRPAVSPAARRRGRRRAGLERARGTHLAHVDLGPELRRELHLGEELLLLRLEAAILLGLDAAEACARARARGARVCERACQRRRVRVWGPPPPVYVAAGALELLHAQSDCICLSLPRGLPSPIATKFFTVTPSNGRSPPFVRRRQLPLRLLASFVFFSTYKQDKV